LLLKLLEMPGHAKATMPSRQAGLDQKSVRRKNQNERPFPDHSADRAVWAANNWNNLNGAAAPVNFAQPRHGVEGHASSIPTSLTRPGSGPERQF
jgi:hypothetical protein